MSSNGLLPNCSDFVPDSNPHCARTVPLQRFARDPDTRRMALMRAGDESALGELYDRHTPLLYSVAERILRSPAETEDVLQDAWCQIWRSAASYDSTRGSVVAWLLTVTRSRALDRYRSVSSRRNAETRPDVHGATNNADPLADAVAGQWNARVRVALEQLPPQQRRVLQMAYFGGLSQIAIARHLNAPLGTVKSWTRQGLTRLRELLPND